MNLKRLFLIQAVATFGTFLLIFINPIAIPQSLGLQMHPDLYILMYLIVANELAIAFLSFSFRKIDDKKYLILVSSFFMIFHLTTAIACIYAIYKGAPNQLLANIIFRILMVGVLYYYGIHQNKTTIHSKFKIL
jgi:hypothetical protein